MSVLETKNNQVDLVLVTWTTGFVGSHVILQLAKYLDVLSYPIQDCSIIHRRTLLLFLIFLRRRE